jgi:hypothetical protein
MPLAPAGVFVLGPMPPSNAFAVSKGAECRPKTVLKAISDADGSHLCEGAGLRGETMESTWTSPNVTGVFLRLLWRDVNPAPGVYDWSNLEHEVDQAIRNGKMYTVSIGAGAKGTPEWIFDDVGGRVPKLELEDGPDDRCGAPFNLGNPTNAEYEAAYFAVLVKLAEFIKARNGRYRALAYVKPSGANLHTLENRLPNRC